MKPRWMNCLLRALVVMLVAGVALPASAEVLKIVVDDTINPITQEYVDRAVDEAGRQHEQALFIELNTPGGLGSSMSGIMEKIMASPVPVIIYVTPSGSHAASAGFFILESADVAAMAPSTTTGSAHPVGPFGGDIPGVMGKKVENDVAALIRSVTSKRGRNVEVAESAVRDSKSFTEQEALSQKLIDYVASSPEDLFKQMQGKTVKLFNGQSVTLNLVGQPVRVFEMSLRQHVLGYLMHPDILLIILVVGALCLYIEFNHPGAVVPGTIGVVCILLAAFAMNLLPVRFAALALILLSFAFFALEAKFATHGVLGIAGIVTMVFGALLLVDAPIPQMRVHVWAALAVSIPFGAITVFLMNIALKARANKVTTGEQGLIGLTGVAQTALSPRGKVFVNGELWDAVSSGPVPAGQAVVVRRVEGLELSVEPAGASDRAPAPVAM